MKGRYTGCMQRALRISQRSLTCLALLLMVGLPGAVPVAFAQAATAADQRIYEVKTKDGERFFGYLQVDTPERVVIRTPGGATIELARADIASIKEATGTLVGQDYRPADPNPTRLFFGPTGRALKKGEGYFGAYELFMPTVQVGVTDRFSIGGGTPLFVGGGEHPFWLTPKFQVYEGRRASVAIGAMHFLNVDGVNLGIAYAVSTFGTRDDAVTTGLGWAYVNDNDDNAGAVVAMVGGEHRMSRRVKLMTENYVFTHGGIVSAGVRFLGESLSADIALAVPFADGEGLFAFPVVNFVWKF